jgi:4-alpha-glucanotransferase
MKPAAELAEQWGIECGYFDIQGRWREAESATVCRIAEALSATGVRPGADSAPAPQIAPAFQGDGRRVWILSVQLYALRSKRNWGQGDFSDLALLLESVADLGGAGVGLNPLHALFHDRTGAASTASPYSPNSRLFLNPLYIDVEAVDDVRPGFGTDASAEIARVRASTMVDYPAVAKLKLAILRQCYERFLQCGSEARRRDLDAFRAEQGHALMRFAAFETLRAHHSGAWQDWPDDCRRPSDELLDRLRREYAAEIGFHEYVQWIADRQLAHCRDVAQRRGLAIGLYLDVAVGVDPIGADAWMDQSAFLQGLSVGAPPDQYSPAGQDWGLTAYNPHSLTASAFEPIRRMLRSAMRYAGAIRIDHVLGLKRLYVIPHESPPAKGAYIRLPFERILQVVADESRRWRCIVVGEDLGTVPEGFRETVAAWGLSSYRVMMFERTHDGSFRHPRDYPEGAVATFNTHDLPSYAGWMRGHDLASKRAIGIDPGEDDAERAASRAALVSALSDICGHNDPSFEDVVAHLAAAPARILACSIEDVLGEIEQINVPGTVDQHPNWRRRLRIGVEEIAADQRARGIASALARAGRGSSPD